MSFFNAEPFFQMVQTYRIVDIDGRFGSGKTSLAFGLAGWLLKNGGYRYLLSNCRSVWTDHPLSIELRPNDNGDLQYVDAVVVLDEGGLFLRYGRDADEFTAFLRKMNVCLILPTFERPAKKLRSITVQRIMNMQRFGIPAWQYQYRLRDVANRETWSFWWLNYQEIFGVFDTLAAPIDDSGLSDFMADVKNQLVEREFQRQEVEGSRYYPGMRDFLEVAQDGYVSRRSDYRPDTGISSGAVSSGVDKGQSLERGLVDADIISDALSEFSEEISSWSSVSGQNGKHRRR